MIAKNCTKDELKLALNEVSRKYNHNIRFVYEPESMNEKRNRWRFRLRVEDSHKAGHSYGLDGKRHSVAACWHVHGDFFDCLMNIQTKAVIQSRNSVITNESGNWVDYNCGSIMYPAMASTKCDCGRSIGKIEFGTLKMNDAGTKLVEADIKTIKCSDIAKCKFFIMVPSHYRDNGSCKCSNAEHRAMMIKEWEYIDEQFKDIPLED